MDKPLRCLHRVVICLDAGNHLNDGGRRVFLKNLASLEYRQISIEGKLRRTKIKQIPSLTLPLHTVLPVLLVRWKHQIHPGQR
jgi:hypothetical protein